MGLLKKFFNDGNITDRYGAKVGHISHLDAHAALDCKIVGRIYEYGDTLEFLNEKNMLTARGKSYGKDKILEVIGLDGNSISKIEKCSFFLFKVLFQKYIFVASFPIPHKSL